MSLEGFEMPLENLELPADSSEGQTEGLAELAESSETQIGGLEALAEDLAAQPEGLEAENLEELAEGLEAPAESVEKPTETLAEPTEEPPAKLPFYVEIGCAIGLAVIVLALAWCGVWFFSTAIYLIGLGLIPYGLWLGRRTNTVYTIFLGCVAAALLTAIYCLWIEMGRYRFDVRARAAKQRVSFTAGLPGSAWARVDKSPVAPDNAVAGG
jgi:hypothetical protein